jgi:hypothetical protein
MYRNRIEGTSPFQAADADEGTRLIAEAGEPAAKPPQADAAPRSVPATIAATPIPDKEAPPRRSRRKVVVVGIAALAIGGAGYFG